jgi:hypothetical protein
LESNSFEYMSVVDHIDFDIPLDILKKGIKIGDIIRVDEDDYYVYKKTKIRYDEVFRCYKIDIRQKNLDILLDGL